MLVAEEGIEVALYDLGEQIAGVREVLEDIRADLQQGLQNGTVILSFAETTGEQLAVDATLAGDALALLVRLKDCLENFSADLRTAVKQQEPSAEVTSADLTMGELKLPPLKERQAAFEDWKTNVRDIAERHTEGVRVLHTKNSAAVLAYEVAPLPDGLFAFKVSGQYMTGDCRSFSIPWDVLPTREECINVVLQRARRHFEQPLQGSVVNTAQRKAQKEMLSLLTDGLFGFEEPEPQKREESPALSEPQPNVAPQSPPSNGSEANPSPGITLFELGETVWAETEDGKEVIAEIASLDDGSNEASVLVLETGQYERVSQDLLRPASDSDQ